ncbi:autophagy-related protein 16-1 [Halyomorpha halys]|uniref:autophagy-related protein 16-1 n=1 Tax=Halyomorpha halys TaxID=286706 RepID=UPI0006D4C9DB
MEGGSTISWRENILNQIQNRNKEQLFKFQDLITSHNRLFDNFNALRHENLQLSIQNEKLRSEGAVVHHGNGNVSILESKLLAQQEELTELHRKRGENAQMLIDLNKKLQEREKQLQVVEESLAERTAMNDSLKRDIQRYKVTIKELENINLHLRDEHQALQLAFYHLEEKIRKLQEENSKLVDQIMKYKSKTAEKMNEENENFLRKCNLRLQRELEDAAKDMKGINFDAIPEDGPTMQRSQVPSKAAIVFDAHDGVASAVQWGPVDRVIATGGEDRKVKLWDVSKGNPENRGVLGASNAGVMSVHFDTTGTYILAASNDYAARVWTVSDQRLRHTLTGHSGKVLAAKFLGDPNKVATGSHDRTLKIWDLRSKACIETKFAGSCCNDLVISDSAGTTIISGHFDKKIRCWDTRTSDSNKREILVQGKVTSLDMGREGNTVLACIRDESLRVIDLRVNQIVSTYKAEGFKVGCDWTRAVYSSSGDFVTAGSSDGNIYVWNTSSELLHAVLKYHQSSVTAVSWHPHGNYIASVDRSKRAIIWADL